MASTIEAAYLAGYEPSDDNLTHEELYAEANAHLQALNK